jgi:hypothetical protein
VARDVHSGEIQNGGRNIDVEHHRLMHRARLDQPWVMHQVRDADRILVHRALVVQAVLAGKEAVVARVDDDGVVEFPALAESVGRSGNVRMLRLSC